MLDLPALHTWRSGAIPMAPLTALLFVQLGMVLVALLDEQRAQRIRVAHATAALGAAASVTLLVLRILEWYPDVERLGLVTSSPTDIAPIGFVSPLTAAWSSLAHTVTWLALPTVQSVSRWRRRATSVLAAAAAITSSLLLVMSIYGPPLLLGEGVAPVAAATASGMVVASLGLVALAVHRHRHTRDTVRTAAPGPGRFAAVFVAVAIAVTMGAYAYFHGVEREVRHLHVAELAAVSSLKTDQLAQWRRERLGDAHIVQQRPMIAAPAAALVRESADQAARSATVAWFQGYAVYQQYDRLMVFDPGGRLVMSHPDAIPPDPALSRAVVEQVALGEPSLLDFRRRYPDNRPTLTLIIPVSETGRASASAVVAIDIDPNRFLYPMLDRWPSSRSDGETLLVGRDEAGAVVLNSTRSTPAAPLTVRMALSSGTISARAIEGARGLLQGIDYSGKRVLAMVSVVDASPWLLITKVDESSVRAAVLRQLWMVVSFAALILVSAGGGLAYTWRVVRERHYRAEAALAGNLQVTGTKLGRLLTHSPTITYTLRRVGAELLADDISDNVQRLFGYTPNEVLTPAWWTDHLHPDDREAALTAFSRIENQDVGGSIEHEYRFQRKDGTYVWVLDQVQVVTREGDRPLVVAGAWTDVTRRRDAERAVRESEHRLQMALVAANQGLWDLDLRTGSAIVSPHYAAMLGYDPNGFTETHAVWLARLHPEDLPECQRVFRDYVEGRRDTYRVECRMRTHQGGWRWILSEGQIVERSNDGTPIRMLGTHVDITSRKDAELRALRLSRLYAALSACNEAIVRCPTPHDLFARVCEAAVTYGGFAMAWVGTVDAATRQIVPVASFGSGLEYLDGLRISLDPTVPEGRGPTGTAARDNRPYFVMDFKTDPATAPWHQRATRFGWLTSAALPLLQNGAVIGTLTIYSHARESFDEDGRRLLHEMASDISFALDAMHRDQQRAAAETALRHSVQEKEALLKEVHHRVKNNLQVISSLLRLEAGRATDAPVRSVLSDMQTRVLSMALLHETLYRSGNLAKVDLSNYLTTLTHQVFHAAGPLANRVTLTLDIAPIQLDLDQAVPCGLLLNELLSNSLKHAFPDGRTGAVTISLRTDHHSPAATLDIRDTGVGLPDDLAERQTRSLGLQLVHDLTRQLRGHLSVTSDQGVCWRLVFTPRATTPDKEQGR
jgi:PAS domain S-box-containing protein